LQLSIGQIAKLIEIVCQVETDRNIGLFAVLTNPQYRHMLGTVEVEFRQEEWLIFIQKLGGRGSLREPQKTIPQIASAVPNKAAHVNRSLYIRQCIMGIVMSKAVSGCELVELENWLAVATIGNGHTIWFKFSTGLNEGQHVTPAITVAIGQIWIVQSLVEGLAHELFVKPQTVVAKKNGRRPFGQLAANGSDHLVVRWRGGIVQPIDGHFGDTKCAWSWNNERQEPRTYLKAFQDVQVFVGPDCRKLQNLIEGGVNASRLGIVKDKPHAPLRSQLDV
jgi:hypothetical protein